MEKLTKAEEPIMQQLWKLKKAFVKDVIRELPEPKPPYNTVSSIIRILETKGMIGHKAYGKTHEYFPAVTRMEYSKFLMTSMVKEYFDGSFSQVMSYMIKSDELSKDEIKELKAMINNTDNG
ncbi:MAG: CopY family transcriptional repressor [Rickettsiales bacterium]|nr:CopY family transcriptional repressor [Rickettsiales bacterium]